MNRTCGSSVDFRVTRVSDIIEHHTYCMVYRNDMHCSEEIRVRDETLRHVQKVETRPFVPCAAWSSFLLWCLCVCVCVEWRQKRDEETIKYPLP